MKNFVKLSVLALALMLSAFSCSKNEAEEVKVVPPPTGCDSAAVNIPMQQQEKVDSLMRKQCWFCGRGADKWNFIVNTQEEYEAIKHKMFHVIDRHTLPSIDFAKYALIAGSLNTCETPGKITVMKFYKTIVRTKMMTGRNSNFFQD